MVCVLTACPFDRPKARLRITRVSGENEKLVFTCSCSKTSCQWEPFFIMSYMFLGSRLHFIAYLVLLMDSSREHLLLPSNVFVHRKNMLHPDSPHKPLSL